MGICAKVVQVTLVVGLQGGLAGASRLLGFERTDDFDLTLSGQNPVAFRPPGSPSSGLRQL
jgi:hypothetical protein